MGASPTLVGPVPSGQSMARHALVLVLIASVLAATGLRAVAASKPAAAPGWSVVQVDSPIYDGLSNLTCPSVTTCFAISTDDASVGLVVSTSDGGAQWATRYQPSSSVQIDALSCASPLDCAAALEGPNSSGVALTVDGGEHWTVSRLPAAPSGGGRVWCASASTCVAVVDATYSKGSLGITYTTTDGGSSWTSKTSNIRGAVSSDLACTSPTVCLEGVSAPGPVYRLMRTIDGGGSWTAVAFRVPMVTPVQVACTSGRRCLAAANGRIYSLKDAGATWSQQHQGQGWLSPVSANCDAAGACAVTLDAEAGHVLLGLSSNGGVSWSLHSFGNGVTGVASACRA